jgi:organic hydroperoxide reductase OsmC/OhrA
MGGSRRHQYAVHVQWTGNRGEGTRDYRAYERAHRITAGVKPAIEASADPAFRGDAGRWNPEDMLVASASACHMLWYLHLCAGAGIVVTDYRDEAAGTMVEAGDGGHFLEIVLRPKVSLAPGSDLARARALHEQAHARCYIANSVNFPVRCEPTFDTG